jgi:hypothetical protein
MSFAAAASGNESDSGETSIKHGTSKKICLLDDPSINLRKKEISGIENILFEYGITTAAYRSGGRLLQAS